ncbi:MAG: hypothetical protein JO154_19710 [Chitinophaga sp.]|uniref:hypothetical protein n=1 Tax=Chitinophaga sp. TaxID=1869181 RepID=UPI0025BD10CD|nr:hypothetical protein [Chitinophaga sp.]MBV8254837.1 hypothetical protein [Chitinophaga sp.]
MAIRKSKEENFIVHGKLPDLMQRIENALSAGGFTQIKVNPILNQLTGDYKKFTVYGEIMITLQEEGEKVKVHAKSVANADNIFALFSSPNQKILNQFKNNLY